MKTKHIVGLVTVWIIFTLISLRAYSWWMYRRFLAEAPGDISAYVEYNPIFKCTEPLIRVVGCKNPEYMGPCTENVFRACFVIFPMGSPWAVTP